MDDFWKALAAVIAAAASISAMAVVVEQFTLRSRLRKTETWAADLLNSETGENRKKKLTEIRLNATARVVGGIEVPLRHFVQPMTWVVVSPIFAGLVVFADPVWRISTVGPVLVAVVAVLLTTRQGIRLYAERARITGEYRGDAAIAGASRRLNYAVRTRPFWIETGAAVLIAVGGCSLGVGTGLASSREGDLPGWPLFLLVAGGILLWAGFHGAWHYGKELSGIGGLSN